MQCRRFPNLSLRRIGTFLLVLAAARCMIASAYAGMYVDSDCHALRLKNASGVPQDKIHSYKFSGTCNINVVKSTGPVVIRTVPVFAAARWDASKKEFTESFHVLANAHVEGHVSEGSSTLNLDQDISSGEVNTTFKCNDDPLISKASCITTAHSNKSGFAPFSNPAQKQNRPLLTGKTTLAEASFLSKQVASNAPSPAEPPAPSPKKNMLSSPKRQRSADVDSASPMQSAAPRSGLPPHAGPVKVVLEGEDLAKAGKFHVTGGKVDVQHMAGFGSGWSADAQLLWIGGTVGAVLDLMVDIPEPGRYAVELYMTRAPDYANLKLEVDGKASPVPINGFSPKVMPTGPLQAGTFSLHSGQRVMSFMIVGKYAQSKGYLMGIDRIVLSKIGKL